MDRDFEIGGRKFKLNKLDAFKQFHIARRIGPILGEVAPALAPIAQKSKNFDELPESDKLDHLATIVLPIMNGLSKLSDEDANFVLLGLLSCAEMQQSQGNWARVATDSMLMFQDLELPVMLVIAGHAFMYNLSNFFTGIPRK